MQQPRAVLRVPRFGVAGAAVMIAFCVAALALTSGGPAAVADATAAAVAADPAALASQ